MPKRNFKYNGPFELEAGGVFESVQLAYHCYGELNEAKNNVVVVCHAFSASSDVSDWWPGLFGKNELLDPSKYFIICPNIIGSPYGSTCPFNIDPISNQAYLRNFPLVTVRDMVRVYLELFKSIGIQGIHMLIGGSFGGHQALELAYLMHNDINNLVLIATSAKETPWSIAIHQAQRLAIEADHSFNEQDKEGGVKGLKAARGMALLNYRTVNAFMHTQQDEQSLFKDFRAASYINYQGQKMVKRFNAYSYYALLNSLDTHDIGRDRGSAKNALKTISCKSLCLGIDTDQLIPVSEQKLLARHMPNATFYEIKSRFGHDGFLLETNQITEAVRKEMAI